VEEVVRNESQGITYNISQKGKKEKKKKKRAAKDTQ
jgi:hypothetical protein